MNVTLKPCPFCGSSDIWIWPKRWTGHGEGGVLYHAGCKQCGAEVCSRSGNYPYDQEQKVGEAGAADAWNSRATRPEAVPPLSLVHALKVIGDGMPPYDTLPAEVKDTCREALDFICGTPAPQPSDS